MLTTNSTESFAKLSSFLRLISNNFQSGTWQERHRWFIRLSENIYDRHQPESFSAHAMWKGDSWWNLHKMAYIARKAVNFQTR